MQAKTARGQQQEALLLILLCNSCGRYRRQQGCEMSHKALLGSVAQKVGKITADEK